MSAMEASAALSIVVEAMNSASVEGNAMSSSSLEHHSVPLTMMDKNVLETIIETVEAAQLEAPSPHRERNRCYKRWVCSSQDAAGLNLL
eukprot:CAMPEP_0115359532 /NCGR_PEP_ID=MMETSP0270-20121206/101219_1 /TAXON_ID=71861 /ORGANISM="Scrippsiella trochoidea, Strain CCMP3099" /LENGTH=88 /DNA_ID=CAMNT_0002782037 /DNA_START=124 /DNA_END=391 /DNA_ORIENTATION=-